MGLLMAWQKLAFKVQNKQPPTTSHSSSSYEQNGADENAEYWSD